MRDISRFALSANDRHPYHREAGCDLNSRDCRRGRGKEKRGQGKGKREEGRCDSAVGGSILGVRYSTLCKRPQSTVLRTLEPSTSGSGPPLAELGLWPEGHSLTEHSRPSQQSILSTQHSALNSLTGTVPRRRGRLRGRGGRRCRRRRGRRGGPGSDPSSPAQRLSQTVRPRRCCRSPPGNR